VTWSFRAIVYSRADITWAFRLENSDKPRFPIEEFGNLPWEVTKETVDGGLRFGSESLPKNAAGPLGRNPLVPLVHHYLGILRGTALQ
jgi:hypothetical protein